MMNVFDWYPALYTDSCQLNMTQGYFLSGKINTPAVFDYFFRENPFSNGYVVFVGLSDLLNVLESLRFKWMSGHLS